MNPLATHGRSVAIDFSAADQVLATPSRGLYISTGGTLIVRMRAGAADTTLAGLVAGKTYDFEIVKIVKAGSDAGGLVLY